MANASEGCAHRFNPYQLTNTAFSFAKAGIFDRQLFTELACESERQIGQFTAQDLAMTAWAFAVAGGSAMPLFVALANA